MVNNFFQNISKDELFKALKCARCSSIEGLQSYEAKSRLKTGGIYTPKYSINFYKTWTNKVPVCKICNEEFKKYWGIRKIISLLIAILLIIFILSFIPALLVGLEDGMRQLFLELISLPIRLSPLIITFLVVGILAFLHRKRAKNNPNKYIRNPFGLVEISPENSEKWYPFRKWAENVLKERISEGNIDPTIFEMKENSLNLDSKVRTLYLMRIEREEIDSGKVIINYICGNCKIKNNLKELEENSGQYQCLSCGAYNHLKQ